MDPQTSFIPKKSLAKDNTVREAPVGLFTVIATLLFFLSILSGAGVYFYKVLLSNDIKNMSQSLELAQKAFEPSLIVELERLDKRIESAKIILDNHVVISPLFRLLEGSTITNVRFNKFNYSYMGNDRIELNTSGQARSYSYIAVQSDNLGKTKYISEHIFSNLNLDNAGNVTFDLFAGIRPELVSYKETLAREAGEIQ